jgi:PmbA protein
LESERAALEYDSRISAVSKSVVGLSYGEKYIANSKGLELKERTNSLVAFVEVIAKQNCSIKEKYDIWFGRDYTKFDPTKLGTNAAKKAVSALNGRSMESGDYNVILKNTVLADILECFSSNFFGDTVNKGFSLLKGKIGEKIASNLITIVDEPLLENGLATTAFDSEGVACYNKSIVEDGILKTFLHNMKSANTAGVSSTGNGFKGSFKGTVKISPTNLYIKNGTTAYTELLNAGASIIVTDVAGLHSGANVVSGDFSLAAEGFNINDGKLGEAIEQITISGNFYNLLNNVTAVADDLEYNSSAVGAPSVLFSNIHISGDNK